MYGDQWSPVVTGYLFRNVHGQRILFFYFSLEKEKSIREGDAATNIFHTA